MKFKKRQLLLKIERDMGQVSNFHFSKAICVSQKELDLIEYILYVLVHDDSDYGIQNDLSQRFGSI